ncbi:MAG: ATP-binding protein [Flammeovirgaceae bacterium]|nr:MAG: ATP-binding protein [Flammeovirgaceae bacterium]
MKKVYKVGCSIENLRGIRDFIRNALKPYGVRELDISEMVLAMDEMCSNLMIHAHQCNPDDLFELSVNLDKRKGVVFEIVDDKSVFDINAFQEPALDHIVHEKRKGGLGIRLVKAIMDEIEYYQQNGKTICRLTKKVQFI